MFKRIACFLLCAALCPTAFYLTRAKAPPTLDTAYLDALGSSYLVSHNKERLFVYRYSRDGVLSGQWETARYAAYDSFEISGMCFDGAGRVFCLVSRQDSRDYTLLEQIWLELDFASGKAAELDRVIYADGRTPYGSAMWYGEDTLLSFTYCPDGFLFRDVTRRSGWELSYDGIDYLGIAHFLSADRVLISDIMGGLYLAAPDGAYRTIRARDAGSMSALLPGAGGSVYYYDPTAAVWMRSNPSAPEVFLVSGLSDSTAMCIWDDRNYIAMERDTPVYYRGDGAAIPLPLPIPFPRNGLVLSLLAGIALGAACAAFLTLKNRRVSLLWKMTAPVLLILALGSALLVYRINRLVEQRHEQAKVMEALRGARSLGAEIDASALSQIDWSRPADSAYFDELYSLIQYQAIEERVKKFLPDQKYEVVPLLLNAYFCLFVAEGDGLIMGISDTRFCNIPIRSGGRIGQEYLALRGDPSLPRPLSGFERADSDWLAVAVPVLDDDGVMVALIEAGFSKQQYLYETERAVRGVLLQISLIIGAAALALFVCLLLMLSSLRKLRFAVEAVEGGDFSLSVPVRGHDEIAGISAAFNQMSLQIEMHTQGLEALNHAYARFLPREVLKELGQESVLSVERGQFKRIHTNVLHLHILQFDLTTRDMEEDRSFEYVNQISQEIIAVVLARGGVVESYRQAEYVCLFESADLAMDAAVQISRGLRKLPPPPEIVAALVRGGALLGVAGHDKRLGTLMLSGVLKLSKQLGQLGAACGARILYTGDVALTRPYHRRSLGRLSFEDGLPEVFECFEGDESALYLSKLTHAARFEEGVRLFQAEAWEASRAVFIQYLKEAGPDSGAKYFLSACDRRMNGHEEEGAVP